MLFIHPMWNHESERIGKQKCTPLGYMLHVIAELIGFLGLLLLFAVPIIPFVWKLFANKFDLSPYWLLAASFSLGITSEMMFQFSWWLARRKRFRFDYEKCEASWVEAGKQVTYKYLA